MEILKSRNNITDQQFLIIDGNKSNGGILKIEIWRRVAHLSKDMQPTKSILIHDKIDFLLIDYHILSNRLSNNLNARVIEYAKTITIYNHERPI
jgi:hypothetical protein